MRQKRLRDSQKSKEDILKAAEEEFSDKGLHGARVDEIAHKAEINKRMIYEYYGSKVDLYKAVLVEVYSRLSRQELGLLSKEESCTDKIRNIIHLYFDFLKDNPSYVNMILWENLNKGKYIQEIDLSQVKDSTLDLLRKVINEGKRDGSFKATMNTEQLVLSLLTYTFSYFSNRYTLSKLMGRNLDEDDNIRQRAENVTEMFLSYMCQV